MKVDKKGISVCKEFYKVKVIFTFGLNIRWLTSCVRVKILNILVPLLKTKNIKSINYTHLWLKINLIIKRRICFCVTQIQRLRTERWTKEDPGETDELPCHDKTSTTRLSVPDRK